MLVFISDLHFTDGTSSASVDAGAVELFAERLNDLAERASWRTGGQYKPIEQIDLVLLGDTIDLLRSSRWQETNARPWSETNSPAFIETARKIVDGVLNHNATSLQYLRALASHGGIALAPASASGQPVFGAELVAVPVHIHYMVGNHDWMLRQRGAEYDAIRRKISQYFGLAHDGRQPFAHEPAEAGTLQEALRRHRVFARHGDVFDPLSFHQDRNESSVSDLLVIELTSHFLADVEQQLGEQLPAATLANLRELDH
ncbi:MAG: metallophosphoesterase, partial [Planctomycetales bacterium]|nr:metallophosphoesterase [Planctomycetales bacterium]